MNNKLLYNQKNKKDLIKDLNDENFKRLTLSFYKYTNLDDLENLRNKLFVDWRKLNVLGRVYIASEGINAQISIPEHNIKKFKTKLTSNKKFKGMQFKNAFIEGQSFLKLIIKVKNEIVAYNISNNAFNMKKVGNHLDYKQFNKAIEEGAIVVDMRNYYEGEVGRFENAIIPDVSRSNKLLPEVEKLLTENKNDKILMYCTGGIRCEKASSYLIKAGYKDVNQLKGGIIQYAHDIRKNNVKSKFIGKNFVFDYRMGEKITNDILSNCHICKSQCDIHTNCANQACHILFIQCLGCLKQYNGCCSTKCADFIKLDIDKQKKLFKSGKVSFSSQKSNSIKPKLYEINN